MSEPQALAVAAFRGRGGAAIWCFFVNLLGCFWQSEAPVLLFQIKKDVGCFVGEAINVFSPFRLWIYGHIRRVGRNSDIGLPVLEYRADNRLSVSDKCRFVKERWLSARQK
jgi:hypothetical protein